MADIKPRMTVRHTTSGITGIVAYVFGSRMKVLTPDQSDDQWYATHEDWEILDAADWGNPS